MTQKTAAWYTACNQCPRGCGINRYERPGLCGETADLRLAWAGLHFGEEPVLTVTGGSGTIFVTGCNLQCAFCQNYQISHDGLGRTVGEQEFVDICLRLQEGGAENINIVTGTHQSMLLLEYLQAAKKAGLSLPIVWNTSSYESPAVIKQLSQVVDIWLPDLKTFSTKIAAQVLVPDYADVAKAAIEKMCELTPLKFSEGTDLSADNVSGKMLSGVILRHLALPAGLDDSRAVLKWFSEKLSGRAILSLMTQYTPVKANKGYNKITAFENRLLNSDEDSALRNMLIEFNIDDGFYQELVPDYGWLPDFTKVKSFSASISRPLWHYTCGFVQNS